MNRSATSLTTFPGSIILGQLVRSLINLVKAYRDRREIMNLAEFDDRMLKDIGLTRSDVDSALAEPLFQNPSLVLVRCAERRTQAERLTVPERGVRSVVPIVRRAECSA